MSWVYRQYQVVVRREMHPKEGMGQGDFKLLAAIGAWTGLKGMLPTILMSSLVGAIIGSIWLFTKGRDQGHADSVRPLSGDCRLDRVHLGRHDDRWLSSGIRLGVGAPLGATGRSRPRPLYGPELRSIAAEAAPTLGTIRYPASG